MIVGRSVFGVGRGVCVCQRERESVCLFVGELHFSCVSIFLHQTGRSAAFSLLYADHTR